MNSLTRVAAALFIFRAIGLAEPAGTQPAAAEESGAPTTTLSVGVDEAAFNPREHLLGDAFGSRRWLFDHGILLDSNLVIDWTDNAMGGLYTHTNLYRERFNFTITGDTKKLGGLDGGTIFAAYQLQHGGNSSSQLTGDAQNINFGTNADGRSQLGQLWYQQELFDDQFRLKVGKMDGNSDFDVLDQGGEFLNNSFSTTPSLFLLPSFPDNGMGVEAFYEPKSGYYAGAGVFDGSIARGYKIGEYGPGHFLESGDNLMLMAEVGKRYKLKIDGNELPGKLSVGGWFNTNEFDTVSGDGRTHGTGGSYVTFDQILYKPSHERPNTAGPPGLDDSLTNTQLEYPRSVALTSSISWADPDAIRIDANALAGLTWIGFVPGRPIDAFGAGVTAAHFSRGAQTRDDLETTGELFYRIRFTQWISLKPDVQYILHPNGGGVAGDPLRSDALAFTLRLEMSF